MCLIPIPGSTKGLLMKYVKWHAGKLSLRVGFIVESSRAELKRLVILREMC